MEEIISNESLAGEEQPLTGRSTRHSSRHRSSRSGAHHKTSRKLWLPIALAIAVLALFFVIVFFVIYISDLAGENATLRTERDKAQRELSQASPELVRQQKIVADMTKGRLPHLLDLVPDKVLAINGPYVKNVVFTVLNQNDKNVYEFKLVMENNTGKKMRPKVRVLVFDRNGVQIGGAEIAHLEELTPGESRSQTAVIDRFIDAEPRYFYVSTLPSLQVAKLQH